MSEPTDALLRARAKWHHRGKCRPDFAIPPGPGQESVWDYPRPPRIEPDARRVVVRLGERVVADTRCALRVLETASPPAFYVPPSDVDRDLLERADGVSLCEWKGEARYWDAVLEERRITRVGWSYERPFPGYEEIRNYLSFYPARVDCSVGSRRVTSQPGAFYGGWVTEEVVGPFKGEPGSEGW